jgi:hypothetical protein
MLAPHMSGEAHGAFWQFWPCVAYATHFPFVHALVDGSQMDAGAVQSAPIWR